VLRLERTDPGFDASGLSAFRPRLIAGAAAALRFDRWRTWCRDRQRLNARGRQRTDSTHVLAAGRALHRLAVVSERVRPVLHSLALVAPAWWYTVRPPAWQDGYTRRAEDDRLPTTQTARAALTLLIGHDGWPLLSALEHADAPPWRRESPAVDTWRQVWLQHDGWDGTQLRWREAAKIPPAAWFRRALDDAEAHDARQHTTPWGGDKVHRTATWEADAPPLMTPVDTGSGPTADGAAPPQLHATLQPRGLLPGTPRVAIGCLDADRFVRSRDDSGGELLGPTRLDDHGPARAGAGVDAQQFQIAGERQHATCPAGKTSLRWTPAIDNRKQAVMQVTCSTKACRRCDHVTHCLRSKQRSARRTRTIRPPPPYQALQTARPREATEAVQAESARRAGIEGTIARATRSMRLRRTRDLGLRRVHLGHLLAAVGLHVLRRGEWFLEPSRAKTRLTPFARLMAHRAAASSDETSPAGSKVTKSPH
jgi:transposase